LKIDRHGKAAALDEEQLDLLMNAAPYPRYLTLLTIQRWTAARIGEALSLTWADINGAITFRKGNTKTKTTPQVPICPKLRETIDAYRVT
jgi:integrase